MNKLEIPKWARIVVGLVGAVVVVNGINQVRGGMREMAGDDASVPQRQTVPGYGPVPGTDPRAQAQSANGPVQQLPITPSASYAPSPETSNYPPQSAQSSPPQSAQYLPNSPPQSPPTDDASRHAYRDAASPDGERFRDPQGRFMISVPQGWRANAYNGGVVVTAGNAFAMVSPFDGAATSEQVVGAIAQQYARQWQNLQVVNQGQTMLSGAPGAYVVFRGVNPRGVQALLRIAGASSNGQAWVVVITAPMQEFNQVSPTLQQIEESFTVGGR